MSDELPEPKPPIISEATGAPITPVDAIGYANVIEGTFILTLCAAHWTPRSDGPGGAPDPRVVSRLRFNEKFARELHAFLVRMLAANAQPEGQVN